MVGIRTERACRGADAGARRSARSRYSRVRRRPAADVVRKRSRCPDFHHDVCSTIQSMVSIVAVLSRVPEVARRSDDVDAAVAFAHPLDGGRAAVVERIGGTRPRRYSEPTRRQYRRLMASSGRRAHDSRRRSSRRFVRYRASPLTMARFATQRLPSASALWRSGSRRPRRKALIAGRLLARDAAARRHGDRGLRTLLDVTAHVGGWPVVEGGSAKLIDAFVTALTTKA